MIVTDGDKCPKTGEIVIIRSGLGCIGCTHLRGMDGSGPLSVNCGYRKDGDGEVRDQGGEGEPARVEEG